MTDEPGHNLLLMTRLTPSTRLSIHTARLELAVYERLPLPTGMTSTFACATLPRVEVLHPWLIAVIERFDQSVHASRYQRIG
jgi:hypothetical protein